MKTLKRIIVIVFSVIGIILICAFFIIGRIAKKGLPDYNANIILRDLIDSVTVYRDSLAIPHIYAKNEHDLYMATGYLLAQDRMWQMDFLRRVTSGRLSEIFGDDFIQIDLLLRSLAFKEKSESILAEGDSTIVNSLKAFSDGVNQYIEDYKGNFPLEFTLLGYKPDPWDPVSSLNLIGYMAWDLKSGWSEFLLEELAKKIDSTHLSELLPEMAIQKTYVYRDANNLLATNNLKKLSCLEEMGLDIFSGSNNWAVSGEKSSTGEPILANDMHLAFGIPGIWYQIHQVIEGKLNVQGLLLPGQPMIIVGHNDSIAWGMTNTYVDNLDYYEEKINPDDTNQYLFNGEWINFKIHNEIIRTKGGREVKGIYRTNHRGPVVSGFRKIPDRVLTIHWVGNEKSNEMRSVYLINRANNWDDFRNAFTTFTSISQNIVYADKKGNIGLYCCAGVPIRKRDKIWAVLPGWTDEYDWKGMVPFDQLPYEYNPTRGYVSSANNRTVDSTYPFHIGTWYDIPYRMDRIREMLDEQSSFSTDDFRRIQNDQHSLFSSLFVTTLLPLLEGKPGWSELEKTVLDSLDAWDFNLSTESPEAAIAEVWAYQFLISTYKDELGDELFQRFLNTAHFSRIAMYYLLIHKNSVWLDNILTGKKESLADIASESFHNTIDTMITQFGMDLSKWKWGDIHQITLTHPIAKVKLLDMIFGLNRGPYRVGGSFHTISPYKYPYFKPKTIEHGSSHRSIYDLNNWSNCISVIPTGISGIPASGYYCNQTSLYVNGQYHPDYYYEAEVKKHARYHMQFIPAASL
jgi:penicillin amidase